MTTTVTTPPAIELHAQILFDRPNCLFVGNIVEIREKAIKVDYCLEPIWANNKLMVFEYTVWMPKSIIIDDRGSLTVKKWFAAAFKGGFKIKKYYLKAGEKKFI